MGKEEAEAATRVIMSKKLFRIGSLYHEVEQFEQELKDKVGAGYSICVTSGTCALQACLAALGIGPGDEIIIPGYTYMATATAVLAVGAIPVIVDIDETQTISPDAVTAAITPHTRAVMPVHINGFPSDMDKICEIAKRHNLYLIEDACQSVGGSYHGKRLGTIGDMGAYSFNHYKIISCGEGGAVLTNNEKYYQRALIYHDTGTAYRPYAGSITEPIYSSFNMRSNEISGAILRVQLGRLDGILSDLRLIKKKMMSELDGKYGLRICTSNDIEGDCGTTLPFIFNTPDKAVAFSAALASMKAIRPIDSDKHVYINWKPLLEKRGGHCDAMNPYLNERNMSLKLDLTCDSCKKTLDIIGRCVNVPLNPDWDEETVNEKIKTIAESAKSLK